MDEIVYQSRGKSEYDGNNEGSFREYLEDRKSGAQQCSDNSEGWWINGSEGGKLDSRQRWSYGSDISIEAVESSQNRLCCSPVDEFDSTISSENEEIIVNNTEEVDESYKDYIKVSPASSPAEAAICRNEHKKRSKNHDVDTADDELIDYSKRYTTDSSILMVENKQVGSPRIQQQQRRNIISNPVTRNVPVKKSASVSNRSKVDPFGDYAETDLDQPTNYSLLYIEDSEEEEEEDTQFYINGVQEDTVKTYYTEGTPYETPSNFSNSTSMSDLLSLEDPREREDATYRKQYLRDQKHEKTEKPTKDFRIEIKRRQIQEDSKHSVLAKINESDNLEACEKKVEKLLTPPQSPAELCDKGKESKTVTFQTEDNFAQETPLMYSRSSSLDSLSEFDQHSILDDGSVISDFSHRTSTVVSPSELPDSPTQTVPPSPRRIKPQSFCNQQQQPTEVMRSTVRMPTSQHRQESSKVVQQPLENHNLQKNQTTLKLDRPTDHGNFFEDGLVTFKEESMHSIPHSTAASVLSALTIDDEGEEECDSQEIINKIAAIRVRTSAAGMHQAPMQKQCHNGSFNEPDKFSRQPQYNNVLNRHFDMRSNCYVVPSPKEEIHFINIEDDNNGYLVCVNRETKNNKYRDSYKDPYYENHQRNSNQNYSNRSRVSNTKRHNDYLSPQKLDSDEIIATDTLRIYCTEDTPTYISPFGSQSNLSALSMLSFSDEYLGLCANSQEDEPRSYNEELRTGSRADDYDTDASSNFSEDDLKGYDDRRIDVSPFDSQLNLDSFALLSIEEENEDEDEDDDDEISKVQGESNNETDNSTKDDSCADDNNAFKRLSYEVYDYDEDDHRVFEECIKSAVLKVTRQRDD